MKKMAGSTNAKDEAERVRALSEEDVGKAASEMDANVFETSSTKVLTRFELFEMDSDELKSGLATGKYILPQ